MTNQFCLVFFLFILSSVVNAEFDELYNQLPFSQQDKQKILQGELISTQVKESEDHELAAMLAFIVKSTPAELKQQFLKGTWIDLPESILTHQRLTTASTIKDLSELKLSSKESDEINNFLSAQAGNNLNLSGAEIKQFQSMKSTEPQAVEEQLHKVLLKRFQAYSTGGVKAITPYQREQGNQFSLAEYFQSITQNIPLLQQYYPVFFQTLNHYPNDKPKQLEESFFALKLEVEGRPTFALMHRMLLEEGDAFALAIRQYYVTQSYNGEQNLGLFIPIKQGVLVVGLFRVSSDAVAGFGSSLKHSIGRRMLASNLIKYFEKVRGLNKK